MSKFSPIEKAAEAKREVAMREHVYKRQADNNSGAMPALQARRLAIMREIADEYRVQAEQIERDYKLELEVQRQTIISAG